MDQDLVDKAIIHYHKTHHMRVYYSDKIFTVMWCNDLGEHDVLTYSDDMDEAIFTANVRLEKLILEKLKKEKKS